jgi:hypothetical protein
MPHTTCSCYPPSPQLAGEQSRAVLHCSAEMLQQLSSPLIRAGLPTCSHVHAASQALAGSIAVAFCSFLSCTPTALLCVYMKRRPRSLSCLRRMHLMLLLLMIPTRTCSCKPTNRQPAHMCMLPPQLHRACHAFVPVTTDTLRHSAGCTYHCYC